MFAVAVVLGIFLQLVSSLKGKKVVQIGCGLQHTVALTE